MKASLVTSCLLGAALLLTGCSGSDEPVEAESSSGGAAPASSQTSSPASSPASDSTTPAPSESATPAPASSAESVAAPTKAELEARITALTDAVGEPFQLVSAEQMAAGLEISQAAMEAADVQPAECRDQAIGNLAATGDFAADAVTGVGAADESGGYLTVTVLDGSTEEAIQQGFDVNRSALEKCSEMTAVVQGNTFTISTEELPQDQIGEETFAAQATQTMGSTPVFHNLVVTAHGNGVIVAVQALSQTELDGAMQDRLADLATQLLDPAVS